MTIWRFYPVVKKQLLFQLEALQLGIRGSTVYVFIIR